MADLEKLNSLKSAGQVAGNIHAAIKKMIKPGLNLLEIEKYTKTAIAKAKMTPAFLGYNDYPAVTCISVNSEIVHGIPSDYKLKNGDIVAVDLGVNCNGWLVDTAWTHPVGDIEPKYQQLLTVTQTALERAIGVVKPGATVGDIGYTIETTVKNGGFSIVRELTGHGVGRKLQEPPSIPNYGQKGRGSVLKEGQVIAIEPITTLEPTDIQLLADGWTIIAAKDVVSAHFEHTIMVTATGAIVLTKPD